MKHTILASLISLVVGFGGGLILSNPVIASLKSELAKVKAELQGLKDSLKAKL